jgi:hypothetical protein
MNPVFWNVAHERCSMDSETGSQIIDFVVIDNVVLIETLCGTLFEIKASSFNLTLLRKAFISSF